MRPRRNFYFVRLVLPLACIAAVVLYRYRWQFHNYLPYEWHWMFSIAIYEGPTPLALSPQRGEPAATFRPEQVTDIHAEFVADPFIVRESTHFWLFFEAWNVATNQGDLAVASSTDARSWHYERVVLNEPFHLSYPYVFEDHGTFYMLPEAAESKTLRLYRAKNFPYEWELYATLLKGTYLDSSIVFYEGRWWIFSCTSYKNDELKLFYSDKLEGPYREHHSNPIVREDSRRSRPGGRVIPYEGHLLRYAQIDQPNYGQGIRAFEVTRLTPDTYEEHEAGPNPIVQASGTGWNAAGMHTVDPLQVGDRYIAAVDGYYFLRKFGLPAAFTTMAHHD